jgi:hypothetical protein
MTTNTRLVLAIAAVAAAWIAPRPAAANPPVKAGKVLVLDNERVLEGDIERVGDQYRVRRPSGETWIPVEKTRFLCADHAEAYRSLRGAANLQDPDERLRLAHWCHRHQLRAEALEEVTVAVQLRPSHADSRRLMNSLQRAQACPPKAPCRAAAESAPVETEASQLLDFNADAIGTFVTRVQPVLMNACASCHAGTQGGSFKLTRAYDALTSRRATQQNLAAVLSQVNRQQPQSSALLSRAITVHGQTDSPPLKGRQAPAYRILEEWVQLAMANGSVMQAAPRETTTIVAQPSRDATVQPPLSGDPSAFAEPVPPKPSVSAQVSAMNDGSEVAPAPTAAPVAASTGVPVRTTGPAAVDEAADLFDPEQFNRQMHPNR